MADSLINLLQARTVLIRAGTSIGTGTLISNGVVLTCAHVVRKAYAQKKSIEVLLPNLTEPGQFIWNEKAQKVYISKKYEERIDSEEIHNNAEQVVLTSEYPDVAVIEIERKTHAIIAFPYNDIVLENLKDGQFLAFGFQKKDRDLHRNVPQAVSLNYNGEQRESAHKPCLHSKLVNKSYCYGF